MTGPTPPGDQSPLASGGMSPAGDTTVVPINDPELDFDDKKVLCSAMCHCYLQPNIGTDGRSLKQMCVSGRLDALDEASGYRSVYKPEVTYDMSKMPPVPFMDKEVQTKNRYLFPSWTQKLWPQDPARPVPYRPGKGYTRRPDVVIVKDPLQPPTHDNIKQVVEMKFPDDPYRPGQREDYIRIAGGATKLVDLRIDDCDCSESEPEKSKVPVEELGKAAAIMRLLYVVITRRPPPRGVPAF